MTKADELLRAADWEGLRARLAAFAYRRTGKRSWERANDVAGQAIADACEHGAWDPDHEPLEKHLVKRVMSLASGEMRRKRSSLEVRMQYAPEWEDVGSDDEPTDDVLHQRRVAKAFADRLEARLENDVEATLLLPHLSDGVTASTALAEATGLSFEEVRAAQKRIRYQAAIVAQELSTELDSEEEFEVSP
jgi:DNA-directed RNA polymerase specialized sigma24 family protein